MICQTVKKYSMNIEIEEMVVEDILAPEGKLQKSPFEQFQDLLLQLKKPEEKICLSLEAMRQSINDKHALRFRDFWEIKKICLPLFKESLSTCTRFRLWKEYVDISTEGKNLKDRLDEQSAFIVEQLDLAISALEKDLQDKEQIMTQLAGQLVLENLPLSATSYDTLQQELYWLGTMASRTNALRKEILKTEMRARLKNKLFERLSKVGDHIFPRRKELIKQVSEQFLKDVEAFAKAAFLDTAPLFGIKADIKAFQSLAKKLTLDTQGFNQTRKILSECWDHVKKKEEIHRQEKAQIDEAQRDVLEKEAKLQQEKNAYLDSLQKQKREKIEVIRTEVEKAINSDLPLEALSQIKDQMQLQIKSLNLTGAEKELLDHLLKTLRDKILDKKEKALLNLSQEEQKSLDYLYHKLAEGQSQHSEIKAQIESYRKALSGSDFDFEKAMHYREMMDAEKERLKKMTIVLKDIEDKIAALEDVETSSTL